MEVCSNGPGHMTKIAAMPICNAVIAGPAGRQAPDHFLGRVCFPTCPFFSFRLILLFTLILFNLPKVIDAIINSTCASSIDRTSQGVKALENYNYT